MFDRGGLRSNTIFGLRSASGRIAVALLMLGLWFGLVGLSTSEHLHQLVHPDAHHVQHECLVTFFHNGLLLYAAGLTAAPAAVFACFALVFLAGRTVCESIDIRLDGSRAPPVLSCLQP